jgi:hypothetical protein
LCSPFGSEFIKSFAFFSSKHPDVFPHIQSSQFDYEYTTLFRHCKVGVTTEPDAGYYLLILGISAIAPGNDTVVVLFWNRSKFYRI